MSKWRSVLTINYIGLCPIARITTFHYSLEEGFGRSLVLVSTQWLGPIC
jgi:hypothetical protein